MSLCKIFLENYDGNYHLGSVIRGRLECTFDTDVRARGIKIRIQCEEYNEWNETETYDDPSDDNRRKTRTITFTGSNKILDSEQILYGSNQGEIRINWGRHVYPFTYTLPRNLPGTFQGSHGSVSYCVEAVVDRPSASDYRDKFFFVVFSPIDFNQLSPSYKNPSCYSDEKTICCWCCQRGNVTMDVELPKTGFIVGEKIPFKVSVCNLSNSNVQSLEGKLVKTITYSVDSPRKQSKKVEETIYSFSERGVGANGQNTYDLRLVIPKHTTIPNFAKCKLFQATYALEVVCRMSGCTMNLAVSVWDIKIGHVNYSDASSASVAPPFQPRQTLPAPPPGYIESVGNPVYPPAPSAPPIIPPPPVYHHVQHANRPPYPQ